MAKSEGVKNDCPFLCLAMLWWVPEGATDWLRVADARRVGPPSNPTVSHRSQPRILALQPLQAVPSNRCRSEIRNPYLQIYQRTCTIMFVL